MTHPPNGTNAMKYLAQASSSALGRLVGALPFIALAVYMVAKLWSLAASVVPNFGG